MEMQTGPWIRHQIHGPVYVLHEYVLGDIRCEVIHSTLMPLPPKALHPSLRAVHNHHSRPPLVESPALTAAWHESGCHKSLDTQINERMAFLYTKAVCYDISCIFSKISVISSADSKKSRLIHSSSKPNKA